MDQKRLVDLLEGGDVLAQRHRQRLETDRTSLELLDERLEHARIHLIQSVLVHVEHVEGVFGHLRVDHAKPHCNSWEFFKGVLGERSKAVFTGRIVVHKDAQKTDAKQSNKTLLLSERAQVNTKPQPEIFADDVKCTHGATVGQLDEDAMFYLRARGLSREQARRMLIHAFATDVLQRITHGPIKAKLDTALLEQLPAADQGSRFA